MRTRFTTNDGYRDTHWRVISVHVLSDDRVRVLAQDEDDRGIIREFTHHPIRLAVPPANHYQRSD